VPDGLAPGEGRRGQENVWGCKHIQGELRKLGIEISKTCVPDILRRNGLPPAPERNGLSWREFLARHADVLLCADLFTQEVWTAFGLQTAYVFFVIHSGAFRQPDYPTNGAQNVGYCHDVDQMGLRTYARQQPCVHFREAQVSRGTVKQSGPHPRRPQSARYSGTSDLAAAWHTQIPAPYAASELRESHWRANPSRFARSIKNLHNPHRFVRLDRKFPACRHRGVQVLVELVR